MSWQKAEISDLKALEEFLIKHETECVAFSAWLKQRIISQLHIQKDLYIFIKKTEHGISEAVLITEYGLICPIIKKRNPGHTHELYRLSKLILQVPNTLSSIMGLKHRVDIIEKIIGKKIKTRIDYHLMSLNTPYLIENHYPQNDIKIFQAKPSDTNKLFKIQKQYELEEVYMDQSLFNENASLAFFRNNLRKEIIFYAEKKGKPIAKAGTNARGYNVYQIGGVFTCYKERRKGIALQLMQELLKYIFAEKKSVCLFVKKTNIAAINLYKKLGFDFLEDFRISYFQNQKQKYF